MVYLHRFENLVADKSQISRAARGSARNLWYYKNLTLFNLFDAKSSCFTPPPTSSSFVCLDLNFTLFVSQASYLYAVMLVHLGINKVFGVSVLIVT